VRWVCLELIRDVDQRGAGEAAISALRVEASQRIRQHTIDGRQRQHMVAERIEDMAGDYRGVH
jgi:hypothetical protein